MEMNTNIKICKQIMLVTILLASDNKHVAT